MKKIIITTLAVLFSAIAVSSCSKDSKKDEPKQAGQTLNVSFEETALKGAEFVITGTPAPAIPGSKELEFMSEMSIKAGSESDYGIYTIVFQNQTKEGGSYISQICGGNLEQCHRPEQEPNVYSETFTLSKDRKSVGYEAKYFIGTELPKESKSYAYSVKVMLGDRVVKSFKVVMRYEAKN